VVRQYVYVYGSEVIFYTYKKILIVRTTFTLLRFENWHLYKHFVLFSMSKRIKATCYNNLYLIYKIDIYFLDSEKQVIFCNEKIMTKIM
jgi:hypothetical protein